ncbi:ankyrin repeat and SOCS box protein 11-like [Scleropages formosus]|nr:ankyrin repeat and SOCS box protein 11-like [Scleropages formosus]
MAECWADRSPLHEAALQGRLLPLRTLITQGFDVNVVTMDGVSALHDACLGGHAACASLLVRNGAKVNVVTVDGVTPLFNACVSGSVRCVEMLLEHCPFPHPEYLAASPIHEAAKRGHKECVELLLSKGANIDLEIPRMGTPLFTACLFQKIDCIKMLLHLGADVQRGRGQDTPLHAAAAAQADSTEVVELLIDYGANVWSRNADGKRPVELIPANGAVEKSLTLREGPSALSQLCRLRVRQLLGPGRLHLVPSFQVPRCLIDFLCYR